MSRISYTAKAILISLASIFLMYKDLNAQPQIKLPLQSIRNEKILSQILKKRFSCRNFLNSPLDITQIASLLWAAGGLNKDAITSATRTIPSAGATYPLEIYLLIGVTSGKNIKAGLYYFNIFNNSLELVAPGDKRPALSEACLGQDFIQEAPISIIITANYSRTTARYNNRGIRYVHMDAGHACQNIYLMAANLNLGTVEVGAFNDNEIKKVLGLKSELEPLAIMPVGYPK